MIRIKNMHIEFEIITDERDDILSTIVNSPIINNGIAIGCVTDVKTTESGYKCLGTIWNKFLDFECVYNTELKLEVDSINIL